MGVCELLHVLLLEADLHRDCLRDPDDVTDRQWASLVFAATRVSRRLPGERQIDLMHLMVDLANGTGRHITFTAVD